jgi:hypothetical protein
MRSAVRNRLIPFNPCEVIKVPKRRRRDTDDQVIERAVIRRRERSSMSLSADGKTEHITYYTPAPGYTPEQLADKLRAKG